MNVSDDACVRRQTGAQATMADVAKIEVTQGHDRTADAFILFVSRSFIAIGSVSSALSPIDICCSDAAFHLSPRWEWHFSFREFQHCFSRRL